MSDEPDNNTSDRSEQPQNSTERDHSGDDSGTGRRAWITPPRMVTSDALFRRSTKDVVEVIANSGLDLFVSGRAGSGKAATIEAALFQTCTPDERSAIRQLIANYSASASKFPTQYGPKNNNGNSSATDFHPLAQSVSHIAWLDGAEIASTTCDDLQEQQPFSRFTARVENRRSKPNLLVTTIEELLSRLGTQTEVASSERCSASPTGRTPTLVITRLDCFSTDLQLQIRALHENTDGCVRLIATTRSPEALTRPFRATYKQLHIPPLSDAEVRKVVTDWLSKGSQKRTGQSKANVPKDTNRSVPDHQRGSGDPSEVVDDTIEPELSDRQRHTAVDTVPQKVDSSTTEATTIIDDVVAISNGNLNRALISVNVIRSLLDVEEQSAHETPLQAISDNSTEIATALQTMKSTIPGKSPGIVLLSASLEKDLETVEQRTLEFLSQGYTPREIVERLIDALINSQQRTYGSEQNTRTSNATTVTEPSKKPSSSFTSSSSVQYPSDSTTTRTQNTGLTDSLAYRHTVEQLAEEGLNLAANGDEFDGLTSILWVCSLVSEAINGNHTATSPKRRPTNPTPPEYTE